MFDTKVERCKKDVVKLIIQEKDIIEALEKAKSDDAALDEASASNSSISERDVAKVTAQIDALNRKLRGTRSLLDKAKQKFDQVLTEERQGDEAEMTALYKSTAAFRKDCLRELSKVIVEAQVLANLARGEAFGTDLLHQVDFLFAPDEADLKAGAKSHGSLIEEITVLTKDRYQKSPCGIKDMLEARINSRKELSIVAEAEKLLSSAMEEIASIKKED